MITAGVIMAVIWQALALAGLLDYLLNGREK